MICGIRANPSDIAIKDYLEKIEEASCEQISFGSEEPQVELLCRIGPGFLKLLIPYLDRKNRISEVSAQPAPW